MKIDRMVLAGAVVLAVLSMTSVGFANEELAPPPEEDPVKGNNGWGNGPDATNAGSFSGATAVTKSVNGLGADKFDGKFTGR